MGKRHTRLAAAMAAAWEAEVASSRSLAAMAEHVYDPPVRARLLVLSAFCRAHASRLLARLSALGRGPLPVPRETADVELPLSGALLHEARVAKGSSDRYLALARLAREQADVSSAWVCELNRAEEADRAEELDRLAIAVGRKEVQPGLGG